MEWFAIQSKPRQEVRADQNLSGWGLETLLPLLCRPVRRKLGYASRIEPLFPNYLFAKFDADQLSAKVRYTRGVSKILGTAIGPIPVADIIIDEIRSRMDAEGLVRPVAALQQGDHVRIVGGPLRDFVGVFDHSMSGSGRVALLLTTVRTQMRVALDGYLIERVS